MRTRPEGYREAAFSGVLKYFGIIMALVYVVAGIIVMLAPTDIFKGFYFKYTFLFGVVLLVYGLFRSYKVYQEFFKK